MYDTICMFRYIKSLDKFIWSQQADECVSSITLMHGSEQLFDPLKAGPWTIIKLPGVTFELTIKVELLDGHENTIWQKTYTTSKGLWKLILIQVFKVAFRDNYPFVHYTENYFYCKLFFSLEASSSTLVLQPIKCSEPSPVRNAVTQVSDDIWNLNSTISYFCIERYTRRGPAIITCELVDGKGEWSDNPPICKLKGSGK